MVSKALASLDAWLALADEVLEEQRRLSKAAPEWTTLPENEDQLSLFGNEAA